MRVVFMGTPDFAVPTLQALISSHHKVVGVFCQPDKVQGRGKKLQMPPVKEVAIAAEIPVYQPNSFKEEGVRQSLESLKPDVLVVIAYGKLLPLWALEVAPLGAINLHGSKLPAYRGAAPIQWSILNGDTETALTIMKMSEGMDEGDILKIIPMAISDEDTSGTLFERMALVGGESIVETLDQLEKGALIAVPQDHEKATYTHKITKEMGLIDWSLPATSLFHLMRGMDPWPGAYTFLEGLRIRIWDATIVEGQGDILPGTVLHVGKQDFTVQTGEGALCIKAVQPDNKKRMSAGDFTRGTGLVIGAVFHG